MLEEQAKQNEQMKDLLRASFKEVNENLATVLPIITETVHEALLT